MFLLCNSKIWSSHFDCFASPVVLNNVNGYTDSHSACSESSGSCDHLIAHMPFPIGGLLEPSLHL